MANAEFKPAGIDGYCGFCGFGDGRLGDQGDEKSQMLSSVVRLGAAGQWDYVRHANALEHSPQYILWCGACEDGLVHKFQRFDDQNLEAMAASHRLWLELDPIRWDVWNAQTDEERSVAMSHRDDAAVHRMKLNMEEEIVLISREQARRAKM